MARSFWMSPAPVALVLVLAGSRARAEPSQAELAVLREMFNEARQAEDGGRWAEALSKLQAVAKLKMTPQVRFHVALCEENLGRLVEALNEFERARVEAADRGLSTVVVEAKKHATDVRARTAKLTVVVPSTRGDVRVEIDGLAVAAVLLSRPLMLDGGKHQVRATSPGFTFAGEVILAERQAQRLELALVPTRSSTEADRAAAARSAPGAVDLARASPSVPRAAGPLPLAPPEAPASDGTSGARTAGWWLIAGGSAAWGDRWRPRSSAPRRSGTSRRYARPTRRALASWRARDDRRRPRASWRSRWVSPEAQRWQRASSWW